ncbi:MAG: discoidin domain-containing protein [Bacteroidaceae bacterium]|nr:discoidin domain-containing protein [Bacteroidaceae bacterium]
MKLSKLITAATALLLAANVSAQNLTADDVIVLSTSNADMRYNGADMTVFVKSEKPYSIKASADWLQAAIDPTNPKIVRVKGKPNMDNVPRTATITFTNEAGCKRNLTVTQEQDQSVETAPMDIRLAVSSKSSTPSNNYGSNTLDLAFDGNNSTFWHSGTQNASYTIEVKLKADQPAADYFQYTPRGDGNDNGNWGEFELLTRCGDATTYTSVGTYNANYSGKTISFPEPIKDLKAYKLVIKPGKAGWISAAEIGMYSIISPESVGADVFTDNMMLALKPGITQEQIDAIPNEFYRFQAQRLFNGYDTQYRYGKYECFLDVNVLSSQWCAPGKLYDQIPGVTGINFIPGKNAVIVRGIPEGESVQLKVVAWWNGWESGSFDGCNPITTPFTLHNGLNIIDYHCENKYGDWPGLAYIAYFSPEVDYSQSIEEQKKAHPDVEVHFVNGQQNGFLSLDKTNDEMHILTDKAYNRCMDLVGDRVHQIWTAKGLHDYCRAADGKVGYLQFINTIDSLIYWQHRSLGFEKYKRVPRNRTMAYVNFTYYMFQGGFGVSFHRDQESRVLNCANLIYRDQDAIWGLSHEWGHQHQMNPYYCWSGMGEVSNNIQSYYNIMMMGYGSSGTSPEGIKYNAAERPSVSEFDEAYRNVVSSQTWKPAKYSTRRHEAYTMYQNNGKNAGLNNSTTYMNFIATMKDSTYTTKAEDPYKAQQIDEGNALIPMLKLMIYFLQNPTSELGQSPSSAYVDFPADWYEALRQNDLDGGSQIEKKSTTPDKYELIASVQNSNQNNAWAKLKKNHPTSVWVTKDYLAEGLRNNNSNSLPFIMNWCRKCSRLTGYNLYNYFWEWGYFRHVAIHIGDYAERWYICTPEQLEEFKADMDALEASGEVKPLPQSVLEAICKCPHWAHPKPAIKNSHE